VVTKWAELTETYKDLASKSEELKNLHEKLNQIREKLTEQPIIIEVGNLYERIPNSRVCQNYPFLTLTVATWMDGFHSRKRWKTFAGGESAFQIASYFPSIGSYN
jgi:hypothetical protein